jgi:hypothetical protein
LLFQSCPASTSVILNPCSLAMVTAASLQKKVSHVPLIIYRFSLGIFMRRGSISTLESVYTYLNAENQYLLGIAFFISNHSVSKNRIHDTKSMRKFLF